MAWLHCLLGTGTKIIGYITKLDHGLADHDGLHDCSMERNTYTVVLLLCML